MSSKAVAPVEAPSVPALRETPATTLTAEDIVVPRIYIANKMSQAVGDGLVKFGSVFLAQGADDPEPNVLWDYGSDEPGALFHVLHVLKGKSWDGGNKGPLERWDFDDPNAPREAWTTYNYTLILPDVDPEMPAKFLLTRSGKPVATRINTKLMREAATGPMWNTAFRLTAKKTKNKDNQEYAVAEIRVVPAEPANVTAAGELFELIRPGLEQRATRSNAPTGEEPTI